MDQESLKEQNSSLLAASETLEDGQINAGSKHHRRLEYCSEALYHYISSLRRNRGSGSTALVAMVKPVPQIW